MPFNTSNFAWLSLGIIKALGSVTAQKSAAKVSGIQLVLFVLRFEWCYNSVSFISHPYRCVYLPAWVLLLLTIDTCGIKNYNFLQCDVIHDGTLRRQS